MKTSKHCSLLDLYRLIQPIIVV